MKNDTFSNRLKKAMDINNLKQIDVVNKTGIDKTLLNKYLKGKSKAKQENLTKLSKILNVDEIWLMGYDIPMNSEEYVKLINFNQTIFTILNYYKISEEELANKTGIDINIIKNWHEEKEIPNNDEIIKIADFFNIKNRDDLFNGNALQNIMNKYREIKNSPSDKYQFGFVLEEMFENLSTELNKSIEELKKIFKTSNNISFDTRNILTYDDLKKFFISYLQKGDGNNEYKC